MLFRASFLLLLGIMMYAGCGTAPSTCAGDGEGCGQSKDCCNAESCTNNFCGGCRSSGTACTSPSGNLIGNCCSGTECLNQNSSPEHGGTCGVQGPSCKTLGQACGTFQGNACCPNLKCTNGICATASATCHGAGQPCTASTTAVCCQNLTCARFGTKCQLGDIGDPCSTNGECLAGLFCNGWCTRSCTSDAGCATTVDLNAGINKCVGVSTGGFLCFPFCSSASECAIYGAGLACSPGNTPSGGTSLNVCG